MNILCYLLLVGLVLGVTRAGILNNQLESDLEELKDINRRSESEESEEEEEEEPGLYEIILGEAGLYKCNVSEWGPWGQCMRNTPCNSRKGALSASQQASASFQLEVTSEYDSGRAAMEMMIEVKEKQWSDVAECREAGTCPELATIPSQGPAKCENGMAGIFPCHLVDLLSFTDFIDLGYTDTKRMRDWRFAGNDLWGWTDPETEEEYVIMGTTGGTSFVRINDPTNPEVVAFMYGRGRASIWRDMKVVKDHVYIGSEFYGHGIQVFDLTRLRGMKEFQEVKPDLQYNEVGNTHNIIANEETGFIYAVGARSDTYTTNLHEDTNELITYNFTNCNGGLHMIDANDPKNPVFVGCYDEDGYTHDAQCVVYHGPDKKYRGREICFNYNEDTLTIVDVTDKSSPVTVSKTGYINRRYTHQGWLTEDHTTVLLDDELDELYNEDFEETRTYIWDVRRLQNPRLANIYIAAHQTSDHNQYILGDLSFQSNYKAGLRIMWINQRAYNLKEIAHFDVLPSESGPGFKGSWSNYPYFKSGVVPVSSIDYGLFLVKPDYDGIRNELASQTDVGTQVRKRDIVSYSKYARCPAIMEARDCEPIGTCD